MQQKLTALLLIAHGSRRPDANADLEFVAEAILARGRYPIVQPSYLELAEPDIESGGVKCVEVGAKCVILLPYFLSAGKHVREDLTRSQQQLALRFPDVEFRLAEPLGRHPMLLDILEQRAAETNSST